MKRAYAARLITSGKKINQRAEGERVATAERIQIFIINPVVGGKPAKESRQRERAIL